MNQYASDQYSYRHHERGSGFVRETDDFKDRLEKLGILTSSASFKHNHSKASCSTNCINLHNWPNMRPAPPPSSCENDDDDDYIDDNSDGDDDEEEDEFRLRLRRSSQAVSRLGLSKAHEKLCRQSAQILLSPLALNNSTDHNLQKLNRSKSFFTLEEDPYDEDDDDMDDENDDDDDDDETYMQEEVEEQGQEVNELQASMGSFHRVGSRYVPLQTRTHVRNKQQSVFINPNHPRSNSMPGQSYWRHEVASEESGRARHQNKHPKHQQVADHVVLHRDGQENTSSRRKAHIVKQAGRPHESTPSVRRSNLQTIPLVNEQKETFAYSGVEVESDGISAEEGASKKVEELQLTHVPDHIQCKELLALCDYKPRNLSQKYRPKMFEEVVGQSLVTRALSNAISKAKIAPVYLFQGSRGTGKTSAARIFAAALVCASSSSSILDVKGNVKRPCGICRECIDVAMGKCSEVKEVDAASNNGIERVKTLLEETIFAPSRSRYKVFIIDECHVLTSETWNALLKILEEPPVNVVFILVTTDPDQLPQTAVSRCQKFPFPKIKEADIVKRLEELSGMENLEVDADTLRLIASRSDGSLRDAETILDQLSLLGQQISSSTVYELVGSASDERMLNLLDCALRADTMSTVRRVRELIDSGIEPLSLMARLATLIADILAGSFKFTEKQRHGFFSKVSDEKLEWLRTAMKTLSEAEKQVRISNDRTTWLTAALLQLGPAPSDGGSCTTFHASCTGTSVTQSPVLLDDITAENADFESTLTSRQTWFADYNDNDDDDDDANNGRNTKSETVPTNAILPSQRSQKAAIQSGMKRHSARHGALLEKMECIQSNQSGSPLSIPQGTFGSPLKAESRFVDQSTSYWPNRSYNISGDSDIVEEQPILDTSDLMNQSYDSKVQIKRKGKMVRVGSVPSSNPNSPDGRGISSRFMTHHTGEALEASHNVATHRRNKLKEAAGSFARFFKGSK